jgi:hypothetical protein
MANDNKEMALQEEATNGILGPFTPSDRRHCSRRDPAISIVNQRRWRVVCDGFSG